MEIDEFLQEKRAMEAKERLEEAKRKLKEEKEHLREEQKKLRESSRGDRFPEDDSQPAKKSDFGLKPWMLWDLIILFVALVLFVIAMVYPQNTGMTVVDNPELSSYIDQKVDEKIATLQSQVDQAEESTTVVAVEEKKEEVKETVDTSEKEKPMALADFQARIEDESGSIAAEIESNSSDEIAYSLIIENLHKDKHMVCKTDRIKDGEETKDFASHIIVKRGEKDRSIYRVNEKGTTNFVYVVRCAFAEYSYEQKLEPVSDFSKPVEAKIKTVLY